MDRFTVNTFCFSRAFVYIRPVPFFFSQCVTRSKQVGIIRTSDRISHTGCHFHHININGIVNQIGRRIGIHCQPIGQTTGFSGQMRIGLAEIIKVHAVQPGHHCLHIFFNHLSIAILGIKLPGDHTHSGRPRRTVGKGGIICQIICRHRTADPARSLRGTTYSLVYPHGHHPLTEKVLNIRIISSRTCICLCITGPTHPFITLRTVCRDGKEVS